MAKPPIDVVAAVRFKDTRERDRWVRRYWVCRRDRSGQHGGLAGLWEYPGGKVAVGEELGEALRREMMEEFGVRALVGDELAVITTTLEGQKWRVHFFQTLFLGWPQLRCHDRTQWCTVPELLAQHHLPSGKEFNRRLQLGTL